MGGSASRTLPDTRRECSITRRDSEDSSHIKLFYSSCSSANLLKNVRLNLQELDLEDRPLPWMQQASVEDVLAASKEEEESKKVYQKRKEQVLHDKRGFSSEGAEYDAYT